MWRFLVLCCAWGALGAQQPQAPQEPQEPQDELVRGLSEAGRARAALCLPGGACAGALWARHWLLARASCLAPHAALGCGRLVLHAGPSACRHLKIEPGATGDVMARFVHPLFPRGSAGADAALLLLTRPARVPPALNHTRAYAAVPGLETWLRHVVGQFPATWDRPPAPAPRPRLASSPTRLLVLAVLLPIAALLLFFVMLLHYTGGPEDLIPYDTLPHVLAETEEPPSKLLEI